MPRAGSTAARDYGRQHQLLRAGWTPQVESGLVDCHAIICLHPTRRIQPGALWDLGHNAERTGWTGPEHRRCNRADGARRGNARRARRTSRVW